jgi:hypothetical protein
MGKVPIILQAVAEFVEFSAGLPLAAESPERLVK